MPRIQIFLDSRKVLDVDPLFLLLLLSMRGDRSLPRIGAELVLRIDAPPSPGNMGGGVVAYQCGKVPDLQGDDPG